VAFWRDGNRDFCCETFSVIIVCLVDGSPSGCRRDRKNYIFIRYAGLVVAYAFDLLVPQPCREPRLSTPHERASIDFSVRHSFRTKSALYTQDAVRGHTDADTSVSWLVISRRRYAPARIQLQGPNPNHTKTPHQSRSPIPAPKYPTPRHPQQADWYEAGGEETILHTKDSRERVPLESSVVCTSSYYQPALLGQ
jgi:hypothetical protein